MPRLIKAAEATAARRRVYGQIVGTDGITPATGEAGGQPQVSINGAAWADAGVGALAHVGDGRYYAELDAATVATAGDWIEARYKSASTAECPLDSVFVVGFDPAADLLASGVPGAYAVGTAGDVLGHLSDVEVTVAGLVAQNGDFALTRGCDYYAADGASFDFTGSAGVWPDLTGATAVVLVAFDVAGNGTSHAMSFVAVGTANQKVRLELSAAQATAFPAGPTTKSRFKVVATLAGGHLYKLLGGTATVTSF